MPLKRKFQVFVSSTYTDLREERQAAVEAILEAGHIPAGMELFAANNEEQMNLIKRWIDESDIYMLIIGGRYGSIGKGSDKSYTHLEYQYAQSKGKPSFTVVLSEEFIARKVNKDGMDMLERDDSKKYKDFRNSILENAVVAMCDDSKDIRLNINRSLKQYEDREDLAGWVHGDEAGNAAEMGAQLSRLLRENSTLHTQINALHKENAHAVPIPKIVMVESVQFGEDKWTRLRTQDLSQLLSSMSRLSPFESNVEEFERKGYWLTLKLKNEGTLKTNLSIRLKSDAHLFDEDDVIGFENSKTAIQIHTGMEDGWNSIELHEDNAITSTHSSARGRIWHLPPGDDHTLTLPISINAIDDGESIQIHISVHPDAGKHINRTIFISNECGRFIIGQTVEN